MTFNRGAALAVMLTVISLPVAACSATPVPATPPRPSAEATTPTPALDGAVPAAVSAVAHTFAGQFEHDQFAGQWAELAPAAQLAWPSAAARAAMLRAKFGHLDVSQVDLGRPHLTSFVPAEQPAAAAVSVWQFPVTVHFADAASLRPTGVAALYSMVPLEVEAGAAGASIIGEGPASLDAPVILPPHIPWHAVDVPIYMYHLVDQVPPRSIEPSTYGWQLEVGLTTLPSAFDAQMAYARRIGAHSISLQHLSDALLYGLPLPTHAFVITFDDGRLSQWTNAVPVLRADDFTAVFFPCTGLIGRRRGPQTYMTAAEIQDLAGTGFSIEDHTINDGTALWNASARELHTLTDVTRTDLQTLTGAPVQFIAYSGPWPWDTADEGGWDETGMFTTLASYGYVGGLLDLRVDSDDDSGHALWQLPRVRVGLGVTTADFGQWLRSQTRTVTIA